MDYSRFADLYDSFVRFKDDLPFFVAECLASPGSVLELMAGTGRVTAELVKSGLRPTCVDSSREMLARLTSKIGSESAFVVRADVRDLPFARTFAIAILPFNAFSELVSEGDRRAALSSIREALAPRGRFICTLHNPAVRLRSVSRQPRIVAQFPDPSGCREVLVRIASEFRW
jgi:SAM-dependent methyltransferase